MCGCSASLGVAGELEWLDSNQQSETTIQQSIRARETQQYVGLLLGRMAVVGTRTIRAARRKKMKKTTDFVQKKEHALHGDEGVDKAGARAVV